MGENSNIEAKITQLAFRQQRQVTRAQLIAIGLASSSIAWRVAHRRLYRVHFGVYSVGPPPITPHEHAMAAVLACGPTAVLSHGSALTLWGIWKRWERPFDVSVSADRRPKGIRVHRSATLDRQDVTRQAGIPVTTLARTLLDMAPTTRPKSINRAVNNGRLEHGLHLNDLIDVIARHPRHRGAGKLSQILGIATKRPTRSDFERSFPSFCRHHGLPEPEMNFRIGRHEVDAFFPEERVIVELDSWDFHSSRTSFEGDREKDAETLALGLVTVRITEERYAKTPDEEGARLRRIVARRRAMAA